MEMALNDRLAHGYCCRAPTRSPRSVAPPTTSSRLPSAASKSRRACSENGVRLAQTMQVGPCVPVGTHL
jgi:hypothetical protein